jgi:integration host factor subunit alpha
MKKADIADRIHVLADISDHAAEAILEFVLDLMKSSLQRGEDITFTGFGKFRVRSKTARRGRIPRTGEEITIPARRVVTFHASGVLKDDVAGIQPNTAEQ